MLLDLDDFEQVNDRHGHETGDDTLRFVAEELKSRIRPTDLRLTYEPRSLALPCAASVGSASMHSGTSSPETVLRETDLDMSGAKRDRDSA